MKKAARPVHISVLLAEEVDEMRMKNPRSYQRWIDSTCDKFQGYVTSANADRLAATLKQAMDDSNNSTNDADRISAAVKFLQMTLGEDNRNTKSEIAVELLRRLMRSELGYRPGS